MTSFVLAVSLVVSIYCESGLREQNNLLRRVDNLQQERCDRALEAADSCTDELLDVMQRLGLDNEARPMVATVWWKRSRRLLGK